MLTLESALSARESLANASALAAASRGRASLCAAHAGRMGVMRMRLPRKLWGVSALAALLAGGLALAPAAVGVQAAGSLSATLAGGSSVSVTLSGVTPGNSYNIFVCSGTPNAPVSPGCVIGSMPLTAGGNGTASGTVTAALNNYATDEVFAQNVDNSGELYSIIVNSPSTTSYTTSGYTAPTTTTTTTTTTSTASCAVGVSITYVNGVPTCSTTGTAVACTAYSVVNGAPVCTSFAGTTTTNCGAYGLVGGVLVCTGTGVPYNGGFCTAYNFVNGQAVCTNYGVGGTFTPIPGCISYTFVNNVPVCLQY
jgi:hypothetical protein